MKRKLLEKLNIHNKSEYEHNMLNFIVNIQNKQEQKLDHIQKTLDTKSNDSYV